MAAEGLIRPAAVAIMPTSRGSRVLPRVLLVVPLAGLLAGCTSSTYTWGWYVVSPFDFIPELIAGPLGIADDAAILGLVAATVMRAAKRPQVVPVPTQP